MKPKGVLSLGPGGRLVLKAQDGTVLDLPSTARMSPRLLYLLIDCSSSMEGDKMIQARGGAIDYASKAMEAGHRVGIISFASSAFLVSGPQATVAGLRPYVDQLFADGSTNMAAAINMATTHLSETESSGLMVIVTDGKPDNHATAIAAANHAKQAGIEIVAIGTSDADSAFLDELASRPEWGLKVSENQLRDAIRDAAKLLPPPPARKG